MSIESGFVPTDFGDFAILDFGGGGPGALLVHEVLDNAEYWRPAAEQMTDFCRPVAVDLQGHGQTAVRGLSQDDHIRALAQVADNLGFHKPLLAGEGVGGWLLTAGTALGRFHPGALLLLECAYAGTHAQMQDHFAQFDVPEFYDTTVARMRLGQMVTAADREGFVAELMSATNRDWSFDDIANDWLEPAVRRSLLRHGGQWLRQPDRETLTNVVRSGGASLPYPSAAVYQDLTVPIHVIMTSEALYHDLPDEIDAMIVAAPNRRLSVVKANFNVTMTHPQDVIRAAQSLIAGMEQDD
ncbi:MAG TPA: alpha/beta hydrolase [Dermatophilaceae bacterium]|nr:alpha/beta hydrolase [Dermatophilaceae bacterium]